MERVILDTHAWIWWMDRDARLGQATLDALDRLAPDERPLLCDISLWEVATLVERRRLSFSIPFDAWLQAAAHPRTVRVLPVTPEVAREVAVLPKTFHRDPADRLIVATCRVLDAALLTHDQQMLDSRLAKRWGKAQRQGPSRSRAGR
jgi:PIN domain nuclease of toxin-antitoxin system